MTPYKREKLSKNSFEHYLNGFPTRDDNEEIVDITPGTTLYKHNKDEFLSQLNEHNRTRDWRCGNCGKSFASDQKDSVTRCCTEDSDAIIKAKKFLESKGFKFIKKKK